MKEVVNAQHCPGQQERPDHQRQDAVGPAPPHLQSVIRADQHGHGVHVGDVRPDDQRGGRQRGLALESGLGHGGPEKRMCKRIH